MTLEKLIYKNYLKTALSSILFIEIILLIIYFSANKSIVNISINSLLNDIQKSVYQTINSSILAIETKFANIEKTTLILQNEHENFFEYKITKKNNESFKTSQNGVFYKDVDNNGASVIVSNRVKLTEKIKSEIYNTEVFDKTLKTTVSLNDLVTAAYFNSHNNYTRYYPFIYDSYLVFPPDFNIENFTFYKDANTKNNPSKRPIWTDIYRDPAGKGWMLSVIAPVYVNGFLEGVSGIDITVDEIIKNIVTSKIPYDGQTLLLDKKGNLIVTTDKVKKILDINGDINYSKTFDKDSINLLRSENQVIKTNFKKALDHNTFTTDFYLNGKKYLLFSKKVKKTSWYIVSLIDEEKITAKMRDVESYYKNLGYGIIISIILFYIGFFFFLHYRAKSFVKIINKPLLTIISLTKNFGEKKKIKMVEKCGIHEIDLLTDNFNEMGNKLNKKLQELKESETKSAFNEKLANTDSLTKAFNRRFLEEYSRNYIRNIKNNADATMSALALDIDNFKSVNDNFGHDKGDEVILLLVNTIKEVIRTNDIIVRLGGDEFLILLPNSNIINARKIGEFLISKVSQTKVKTDKKDINFTISVGSAEYEEDDISINDLIKRADKALYRAKDLGKNCII